jgi:hypothetical protein
LKINRYETKGYELECDTGEPKAKWYLRAIDWCERISLGKGLSEIEIDEQADDKLTKFMYNVLCHSLVKVENLTDENDKPLLLEHEDVTYYNTTYKRCKYSSFKGFPVDIMSELIKVAMQVNHLSEEEKKASDCTGELSLSGSSTVQETKHVNANKGKGSTLPILTNSTPIVQDTATNACGNTSGTVSS